MLGGISSISIYLLLVVLDQFYFTTANYNSKEIILAVFILFFTVSIGPTTNISVLTDNARYSALAAIICYSTCIISIMGFGTSDINSALAILILEVFLYKGIQIILLRSYARIDGHFILGLIK